jgi:hypothetical protein
MNENSIELVRTVVGYLRDNGIDVLLGGGWAEELQGIIKPREHGDIDLHYLANDFQKLDKYIAVSGVEEIEAKHKSHKRAYKQNGVMVEVILIQKDNQGNYSNYNQEKVIRWPEFLSVSVDGLSCLSPEALKFKRSVHHFLFPREQF